MKKSTFITGCLFILFGTTNLFAQTVSSAGKGNLKSVTIVQSGSDGTVHGVAVSCDNSSDKDCYQVVTIDERVSIDYTNPKTYIKESIKAEKILSIESTKDFNGVTDLIKYIPERKK